MTLGERIKELRELQGWKQSELANKVGVTQPTVAGWESGTHQLRPENRETLIKVFGITPNELYGVTSSKISPEILEALQDPIAVKALLITFKNKRDIKNTIRSLLETIPNLSLEKRQAILALCK